MKVSPLLIGFFLGIAASGLGYLSFHHFGEEETSANKIVATVGSEVVTTDEFSDAVRARTGVAGTPPEREALLEEIIERKALLTQARNRFADEQAALLRQFENQLVGRFLEEKEKQLRANYSQPSLDELREFYGLNLDRYTTPERRRIALILVASKDPEKVASLQSIRAKILAEATKTKADALWNEAVVQFSGDRASRYQGGDQGWFERDGIYRLEAQVLWAVFDLDKVGDISDPITTPNGTYLVKLSDFSPETTTPFEEVENEVRYHYIETQTEDALSTFKEEARREIKVRIDQKILSGIPIESGSNAESPALPKLP